MKKQTKILLLHGWDWKKYPKYSPKHQWENRQDFINMLGEYFDVDYPSLPGFDTNSRENDKPWSLDDYSVWLKKLLDTGRYDAIIGYSFGCAVIVKCLYQYNIKIATVLISPAIIREYKVKSSWIVLKTKSILKSLHMTILVEYATDLYLRFWIRNSFYIEGNKFLRQTYRNIVKIDLSFECKKLVDRKYPLAFIFGSLDTATPKSTFIKSVPQAESDLVLIEGAGHNVGGTHPLNVVENVVKILQERME